MVMMRMRMRMMKTSVRRIALSSLSFLFFFFVLLLLLSGKLSENKWWARKMLHNQSRSPWLLKTALAEEPLLARDEEPVQGSQGGGGFWWRRAPEEAPSGCTASMISFREKSLAVGSNQGQRWKQLGYTPPLHTLMLLFGILNQDYSNIQIIKLLYGIMCINRNT